MNNGYQYGGFDKFLHWLIALNIGLTLIFANGMSTLPDELKIHEYGDHAMSVTSILILMIIRLIWRLIKGFPLLPDSISSWQKIVAKAVLYLFYIVIFAQLFVGVLLSSTVEHDFVAAAYGINYSSFNLVADDLHDKLLSLHINLYYVILAMVSLHILAALKHHFIDKDHIMISMLPFVKKRLHS